MQLPHKAATMPFIADYVASLPETEYYKQAYYYYNEQQFHKIEGWARFLDLSVQYEANGMKPMALSRSGEAAFDDAYNYLHFQARNHRKKDKASTTLGTQLQIKSCLKQPTVRFKLSEDQPSGIEDSFKEHVGDSEAGTIDGEGLTAGEAEAGNAESESQQSLPPAKVEETVPEIEVLENPAGGTNNGPPLPQEPLAPAEGNVAAGPAPSDLVAPSPDDAVTPVPNAVPMEQPLPVTTETSQRDRYYEGFAGRWVINHPGRWRNKRTGRPCTHGPSWVRAPTRSVFQK